MNSSLNVLQNKCISMRRRTLLINYGFKSSVLYALKFDDLFSIVFLSYTDSVPKAAANANLSGAGTPQLHGLP